jgi:hypothetical protein
VVVWHGLLNAVLANEPAQPGKSCVEGALQDILSLERSGQRGFATVWDGNKYVKCERRDDGEVRCDAAG